MKRQTMKRQMMSRQTTRRALRGRAASALAALALTLAGCSVGLEDLPAPAGTDGPTYHLTAAFEDVSNLTLGADVKLGGVQIGEVSSITTRDYQAAVGLTIEKRFRLGRDAALQIRFTTPLGDDFVSVTSVGHPARGVLADGATVPLAQTRTAPGIEDTFAAVSTLLNYGGLDKLHTIATQLDIALHGRTGNARSVLENLQKVVANLDTHKGDIDKVLDGLDKLTGTLNDDTATIEAALDLFPPTLQTLASDTAQIRTLLTKVGTLGTTVKGLLARGQTALLADLDNLQPTLASLRARDDELIPTLTALTQLGKSFQRAAPGDYLNVSASIRFLLNAQPSRPRAGGTPRDDSVSAMQRLMTTGGRG